MLCWLGILAEEARAEGRQRRAEIWRTTFNSFSRFLGGKDIGLRQMEGRLMQRYENHLLAGGLCPNTTSFYLRNLRSAYSKAVKAKLCPAPRQNPFAEVYTGVAKTRKRAVCADTLRAIRKLDLDGRPDLDYARNLFLLSFYTRGMAFADMAGLRRSDLKEHPVLRAAQDGQAAVHPLGGTDAGDVGSFMAERGGDEGCRPTVGREAAFPPRCRSTRWAVAGLQ